MSNDKKFVKVIVHTWDLSSVWAYGSIHEFIRSGLTLGNIVVASSLGDGILLSGTYEYVDDSNFVVSNEHELLIMSEEEEIEII